MKKIYSFFLMLLMAVALHGQNAVEHNGIWYLLDDEALTAKVTYQGNYASEYDEYSGAVVVPATVFMNDKTYAVTEIYDGAFKNCRGLTSITLPEGIQTLGWSSFEGCTGLASLVCPNSLEKISHDVFKGCTGLKSITFGTGLKNIYDRAFMNCNAVEIIICKATTPPYLIYGLPGATEENPNPDPYVVFENVDCSQIPVYVPAASVAKYYREDQWKDFKFIKAYDAETIVIDDEEAKAVAAESSVDIQWRAVDEAIAYIIEIRHDEELICSMTFNAEGIILSATYSAPARNRADHKAPAAIPMNNGWKYTIDGLEADQEYVYSVIAKNSADGVIYSKSDSFRTQASQGIESIQPSAVRSHKVIIDGQLLILRADKTYTLTGQEVK